MIYSICLYRDACYAFIAMPPSNEQKRNALLMILTVGQDTLLHWETLLVVSASNFENVALPLITKMVGFDFSAHALLVEQSQLVVIVDLKSFLSSRRGKRDV